MNIKIKPAQSLKGAVSLPGDKSISHRALMFGAIAEGVTEITNLASGKDVNSTAECLRQLGVRIDETGHTIRVHGVGTNGFQKPHKPLDAGNSGTTMRLMAGILAAQQFNTEVIGDASLSKRPMARVIQPLEQMGARIDSEEGFRAPLKIYGSQLHALTYQSPVASAQIKSCLLLAGLYTSGQTRVIEPALSRDHTERMLNAFGVAVNRDGLTVSLTGPASLKATPVHVPGDISAAAFFLVAGALLPDSELCIRNVGINPTRTGILSALRSMGCSIMETQKRTMSGEPMADLIVKSSRLKGTVIEGDLIPQLIDEIPVLAIAALFAEGKTIIRDARELRVKETDRIAALEKNLTGMGARIETFEDGFCITGPQRLTGAVIKPYHDHRIAMAFAVAGLLAEGETCIQDAEVAEISHPGFYRTLEDITVV